MNQRQIILSVFIVICTGLLLQIIACDESLAGINELLNIQPRLTIEFHKEYQIYESYSYSCYDCDWQWNCSWETCYGKRWSEVYPASQTYKCSDGETKKLDSSIGSTATAVLNDDGSITVTYTISETEGILSATAVPGTEDVTWGDWAKCYNNSVNMRIGLKAQVN